MRDDASLGKDECLNGSAGRRPPATGVDDVAVVVLVKRAVMPRDQNRLPGEFWMHGLDGSTVMDGGDSADFSC